MKAFLLIFGTALFILGIQDGIRLLVNSSQSSIFSWMHGETSLYIGLDVALAILGALIADYASRSKEKPTAK